MRGVSDTYKAQRKRRYRREWRFRLYCRLAMLIALIMLGWLLMTLFALGLPALLGGGTTEGTIGGTTGRGLDLSLITQIDSADPARAGTRTAWFGSAFMVLLAALLAIPAGVVSAIYLQEFAPRSGMGRRISRILEVLINNLAAVPAIVYGLLGLAVFINGFGLARSAVLTGGLVLALRIVPTVIIGCRGALSSVPDQIVDGALSLGASRMQAIFGHKLPLAAPGMATASLLAVAQALGEAAPLLLIGMVAYISSAPDSVTDPATTLPVQIFMWAQGGTEAWSERAAGAVIVLLLLLLVVHLLALWIRARLSKRRSL
jgi:phosphate transport system permease protein